MTSINNVFLTGNLTRDLEVKQITEKFSVGSTSIAVNRAYKDGDEWKEETSFIELKLKGNLATGMKDFLKKGKSVTIHGSLIQERWEKDGQKFSKVLVDVQKVVLGGGKNNSENESNQSAEASNVTSYDSNGFPEDVPF